MGALRPIQLDRIRAPLLRLDAQETKPKMPLVDPELLDNDRKTRRRRHPGEGEDGGAETVRLAL